MWSRARRKKSPGTPWMDLQFSSARRLKMCWAKGMEVGMVADCSKQRGWS